MHVSCVKDKWVSKLDTGSPVAHACLCLKNSINLSIGMALLVTVVSSRLVSFFGVLCCMMNELIANGNYLLIWHHLRTMVYCF